MLDEKSASALKKIITNPHFNKRVNLEEQKEQMQDRFLSGRHIAYMINECFRVTGAHEAVHDCAKFLQYLFTYFDDIQDFDARRALLSTKELPKDSILESV